MKASLNFTDIVMGITILVSVYSIAISVTATCQKKVILEQQNTIDSLNVQVENYKLLYKLG